MLLVTARAPITDAASASAYLTRCRSLPTYLDQYAARLRTAAASGLLPVAPLVDSAISQLRTSRDPTDRGARREPEVGARGEALPFLPEAESVSLRVLEPCGPVTLDAGDPLGVGLTGGR
jgi:hypothetical protein